MEKVSAFFFLSMVAAEMICLGFTTINSVSIIKNLPIAIVSHLIYLFLYQNLTEKDILMLGDNSPCFRASCLFLRLFFKDIGKVNSLR